MVRVTGAPAELSELAAEFPGYEFATQPTWDGISIIARRHGDCARPGLYAVVTDDLDEMRGALLEHERSGFRGDSPDVAPLGHTPRYTAHHHPWGAAGFSHTETCERLSVVKGSRFQPAQRSRNRSPASWAIRSSSDGHA